MTRPVAKEKALDIALENALRDRPEFTRWFLAKTKFAEDHPTYAWSRADNPWGAASLDVPDPATGRLTTISREGETDVLAVFETRAKKLVALHIENKLATGHFTPFQPELYRSRAEKWRGLSKYHAYEDWQVVLVAPLVFFDKHESEARKFDLFVSHEEIAARLPEFKG